MPSNPTAEQLTFSNYKNCDTFKAFPFLVLLALYLIFMEGTYPTKIVQCGILKLVEPGDSIITDKIPTSYKQNIALSD